MPVRSLCAAIVVLALAGVLGAPTAQAAPPNDSFNAAGAFEAFAAPAGKPTELTTIADLTGATPDAGVPRCLGPKSFERTVWYRLPEVGATQWITISAVGQSLNVVDLAAFIQPQLIPPATPTSSNVKQPNVCDGVGAGGSAAAEEPTSAISFVVPPYHPVLVQVGRRGVNAEATFLYVDAIASEVIGAPAGDIASEAPKARLGTSFVSLAGATITEEDPSEPTCPSLGTVWRKYTPGEDGRKLITVRGTAATTLTAYQGARPTGDNVLDCVNRESSGDMQMVVNGKKNKPIWLRLGTERTTGDEEASLDIADGTNEYVVDGGPGGFDPTRGGPGGGLPSSCDNPVAEEGGVTGPRFKSSVAQLGGAARFPVSVSLNKDVRLCDVTVTLRGPSGLEYAKKRFITLKPGAQKLFLPRLRSLVPGRYVLRIDALSSELKTVKVRSAVSGRLVRK